MIDCAACVLWPWSGDEGYWQAQEELLYANKTTWDRPEGLQPLKTKRQGTKIFKIREVDPEATSWAWVDAQP